MVILVSEASNRYTHLFLVEREYFGFNTFESVIVEKLWNIYHIWISCLEIVMCKTVEIWKRGDVLRYHPGIKNLTKKNQNPVD